MGESVTSEEGRRTRTRGTGHNLRNSRPEARQAIIKVNKTRAVKNSSDTSSKSEGYENQRRRDHWHYQELLATPIRKHFLTVCQLISDEANFFKTFEEIFQDCLYPGTTWLKRAKIRVAARSWRDLLCTFTEVGKLAGFAFSNLTVIHQTFKSKNKSETSWN